MERGEYNIDEKGKEEKETAMVRISKDTNTLLGELVDRCELIGKVKVGESCGFFPVEMVSINKGEVVKFAVMLLEAKIALTSHLGSPPVIPFDSLGDESKTGLCKWVLEYVEECQQMLEEGLMAKYEHNKGILEGIERMLEEVDQGMHDTLVTTWIATVKKMAPLIEGREDAPKDKYTKEALDNLGKIKDFLLQYA